MTRTSRSVAQRDPGTLLRRIGRHVPFGRDRVVLAIIRLSRSYVDHAGWIDLPPPSPAASSGRSPAGSSGGTIGAAEARTALRGMLATMAPKERPSPPTHAVVMVRCRRGRVVWLPTDDAWLHALTDESGLYGLPVADVFLVTEHGWRCRSGTTAGQLPALAA
ncbi:hypothetical protein [Actinopolymorpha sp. B9G3]|uniref:hypothetical protein n=1 Tax=Actinopolymorpha sp. B9G3 TaxID=3158970 RepID=UPI0032D99C61